MQNKRKKNFKQKKKEEILANLYVTRCTIINYDSSKFVFNKIYMTLIFEMDKLKLHSTLFYSFIVALTSRV